MRIKSLVLCVGVVLGTWCAWLGEGLVGSAWGEEERGGRVALGERLPPLPAVKWLKGEAIPEWKTGEVYVLDFWATWCRPCIAGIPHLIEIQEKYGDRGVHVVGVAVWAREKQKPTAEFIAQYKTPEGKGINYRIAEEVNLSVADAYLEPLGVNSIPTMMIIDRQGRLAWVGHPMNGADAVLEQVVAGTFDLDKHAAEARARAATEAKARPVLMELQRAQMAGDWNALVESADKLIALDAKSFAQAGLYKYIVLAVKIGDKVKAASYGRELVGGVFADNSMLLANLAHLIAEHEEIKDEDRDLDLALAAVQRAETLTDGNRAMVYGSLARVHFARKETAEAVAAAEKAVSLAGDDAELKADFEKLLTEYRSAAGK